MIKYDYIRERIEKHGFTFTGKFGLGKPPTRRFVGPNMGHLPGFPLVTTTRGSLYIRDNYLSANGQYAHLQELVRPTNPARDEFAASAPEWKGGDLVNLLDKLDELFSAAQKPEPNPGTD